MPYIPERFDDIYKIILPRKKLALDKNFQNLTLGQNETILEIGCGPGHLTLDIILPKFQPYLKHIVAVDINESMITLAKNKYSHPQIHYKELDFSKPVTEKVKKELLLNDSTVNGFDKIISFYCFQDIRDQRIVSRNIYTLLRPGGEALVFLAGKNTHSDMVVGLSKISKWSKNIQNAENHISFYYYSENPAQEFKQYLEEAGLEVVYCTENNEVFKYKTSQELRDVVCSLDTCIDKIPPEIKEDYINDAVEIIKEAYESCEFKLKTLTALARKPAK